jgi:maltose-binding protein MalE
MRVLVLALTLGIALLFTACTRPADPRPRIRIWHQKIGTEREMFFRHIREFNAQHPNVLVETLYKEPEEMRNLFVIAAVAGQGPELIYGAADNVGVLVTTQSLLPLESVFPPEYFEGFIPQGLVEWKGQRWLIADQLGNHLTLVYNKSLVPKPPETLDELITIGQSLTRDLTGNGRPDQYGLTWNYREPFFFIPFLTAFGGWVMDENGNPTLDNESTVRAIQFVLDLRDKHKIIPREGDYDIADMLFKEGRTGMIINGPWAWSGYKVPEQSMVARLPFNTETQLWCEPIISARGYSINGNVKPEQLPMIRALLEHLTSAAVQEEMALKLATAPTVKAVLESPVMQQNPALVASMQQIETGRPMPIMPQMRMIWDGMRGPYQLVMNGAITAQEAARRMQREAEKNIADANL